MDDRAATQRVTLNTIPIVYLRVKSNWTKRSSTVLRLAT